MLLSFSSCSNLSRTLEKVYKNDQKPREHLLDLSKLSTDEILHYHELVSQVDSTNQKIVSSILDNYGWPTNISRKANKAIWIVIDHADLDYQLKYIDMVQEQANLGIVSKSDYAVLYDKLLKNLGKPQKYGTQIYTSIVLVGETMTDCTYLWPVENGEQLDSLRNSVDLPPIKDYIQSVKEITGLNVIWDKDKNMSDFLGQ